ncbi:hypothetical protein Lal_00037919 [Lupinus albus]|nr:hypothetical protein Lal_00037919 [Lupinus albus]
MSQPNHWLRYHLLEQTAIREPQTTGSIWPKSKSFSDKGIGHVPKKWHGGQICQINKLRGSNKVPCNRSYISFTKSFSCSTYLYFINLIANLFKEHYDIVRYI